MWLISVTIILLKKKKRKTTDIQIIRWDLLKYCLTFRSATSRGGCSHSGSCTNYQATTNKKEEGILQSCKEAINIPIRKTGKDTCNPVVRVFGLCLLQVVQVFPFWWQRVLTGGLKFSSQLVSRCLNPFKSWLVMYWRVDEAFWTFEAFHFQPASQPASHLVHQNSTSEALSAH